MRAPASTRGERHATRAAREHEAARLHRRRSRDRRGSRGRRPCGVDRRDAARRPPPREPPVADVIHGLGGNDTIAALGGNDRLFGDAGNDKLDGGAGNDILTRRARLGPVRLRAGPRHRECRPEGHRGRRLRSGEGPRAAGPRPAPVPTPSAPVPPPPAAPCRGRMATTPARRLRPRLRSAFDVSWGGTLVLNLATGQVNVSCVRSSGFRAAASRARHRWLRTGRSRSAIRRSRAWSASPGPSAIWRSRGSSRGTRRAGRSTR